MWNEIGPNRLSLARTLVCTYNVLWHQYGLISDNTLHLAGLRAKKFAFNKHEKSRKSKPCVWEHWWKVKVTRGWNDKCLKQGGVTNQTEVCSPQLLSKDFKVILLMVSWILSQISDDEFSTNYITLLAYCGSFRSSRFQGTVIIVSKPKATFKIDFFSSTHKRLNVLSVNYDIESKVSDFEKHFTALQKSMLCILLSLHK